jgi:hypothetical protein
MKVNGSLYKNRGTIKVHGDLWVRGEVYKNGDLQVDGTIYCTQFYGNEQGRGTVAHSEAQYNNADTFVMVQMTAAWFDDGNDVENAQGGHGDGGGYNTSTSFRKLPVQGRGADETPPSFNPTLQNFKSRSFFNRNNRLKTKKVEKINTGSALVTFSSRSHLEYFLSFLPQALDEDHKTVLKDVAYLARHAKLQGYGLEHQTGMGHVMEQSGKLAVGVKDGIVAGAGHITKVRSPLLSTSSFPHTCSNTSAPH